MADGVEPQVSGEKREPRVVLAIRVNPAGKKLLTEWAEAEGVTRSEMARRLFAEAVTARRKRAERIARGSR